MKVCIYVKDNNINSLKVLIQSLKTSGCHNDDVILISDNCKNISLGYDSIFNVIKIQCRSIGDLKMYKNDNHVYSEDYLIVTENTEFTKHSFKLALEMRGTDTKVIYKNHLIALITQNIEDIALFNRNLDTNQDTEFKLIKDQIDLTAYSKPMDILLFESLQILLYVESSIPL
jgi:hypothetical protein